MINKLIGGAIVVLVGCSLLPEVSKQVKYGRDDFWKESFNKPIKSDKHKQTYEEYVRERLSVEKMLRRGW